VDRILLGQLGANGDCLYATILARQLRADYPSAHIVWAVSSQCAPVLANNPHIDAIWEIPVSGWDQHETMWRLFEREALSRYVRREFDHVLLSQIWPSNFQNFDGTVRPSILRSYGRPITVPIENVINLTNQEVEKVETFVAMRHLEDFEHRILFECSSKSGQSFVTPELAQEVARELYRRVPTASVIFSTHQPMVLADKRSRYAGCLSLREIAHLTHYCTMFVGSGSGCSVVAGSTAAKPLPMIQLLSASTSVFASFAHDMEYFGITDREILEMTDEDPDHIAACIATACENGMAKAIDAYDSRISVAFDHYIGLIEMMLLANHRYLDAARSVITTVVRYGWRPELVDFARHKILDQLPLDPRWLFSDNSGVRDELRARLVGANGAQSQRVAGQALFQKGT
jgi:hypothetical protein